jgi:drug/metabolite transporter (DMT)-like permease
VIGPVLALLASASWGFADFLGGLKSRTIPVLAVMAVAQPAGLASVALVTAVRGEGPPPGRTILWAIPAALLGTTGIMAFYRGMSIGAISLVAPIAGTGAAIPVVFGLATGDDLSTQQLAGFGLALVGIVLASLESHPERSSARLGAGIGWGLVAAVTFGAYFVPMHEAASADWAWASLVFRITSFSLVVLAVLAVRPQLRGVRGNLAALALVGLLDTGGNVFFALAATHGLVSVVSVLASLYPVVTVVLALALLRERPALWQGGGALAALAGVLLVSSG